MQEEANDIYVAPDNTKDKDNQPELSKETE